MTSRIGYPASVRRIILLCGLLLPSSAFAQDVPPEQAQAIVAPKLQDVLEHAPPNEPVPWNDEASGLSGTITASAGTFSGRPCRAVRYTVQDASRQLAMEGERCREPDGRWVAGRVADAVTTGPVASPLIRDLQAALRRLDYYRGRLDGVASPELSRALLFFEHDEQVPPDAEPSPGLLELAGAAIGRIPVPGSCTPEQSVPEGMSAACGSIR